LETGDHLRTNNYLVGEQFSAADLKFCSLVKPLQRVPCFSDDRRFKIIFNYHERIRQKYDPKYPNSDSLIEKIVDQHRAQVKKNEKNLTTRIKTFIH
jgi:glutathione S-transferase